MKKQLDYFNNLNPHKSNLVYEGGLPGSVGNTKVWIEPKKHSLLFRNGNNGSEFIRLRRGEINNIRVENPQNPRLYFDINRDNVQSLLSFKSVNKDAYQMFSDIKYNLQEFWKAVDENPNAEKEIKDFNERRDAANRQKANGCLFVFAVIIGLGILYYFSEKKASPPAETFANVSDSAVVSDDPAFNVPDVEVSKEQVAEIEKIRKNAAQASTGSAERKKYGEDLRNLLLDKGMNIKVTVYGKDNRKIKLTYILFDEVWRRKFETEGYFDMIHDKGFTDIQLSDGYEYGEGVRYDK